MRSRLEPMVRRFVVLCVLPLIACGGDSGVGTGSGGSSSGSTTDDGSSSSLTNLTTGISASITDTSDDASSSTSGLDTDGSSSGDGCAGQAAPLLLSMDPVAYPRSAAQVSVSLTFDQEVTIAAGGLSVDGGATITAPELPATGETFSVTVEGVVGPGPFTFTVDAASVTESVCELAMEADATLSLAADCDENSAPTLTADAFHQLDENTTTDTYVLSFDEPVTLFAGALSVSGDASIESVSPALPATAESFTVELSNLEGPVALSVDAASVADGCGVGLDADAQLWVCSGNRVSFAHTADAQSFVVPACAQGSLSITAHGAEGQSIISGGAAGLGAQASGDLAVTTGETLAIYVGGQGGFNGGAAPGSGGVGIAGHGGGASDVRQGGDALEQRVLVAGGGGGGASPPQGSCGSVGGGGGGQGGGPDGTVGGNGTDACLGVSSGGTGGTQDAGGTGGIPTTNCGLSPLSGGLGMLGVGGAGSTGTDCNGSGLTGGGGGGGGGGFYGGGGGAGGPGGASGAWSGSGGGGGSSYVGGVTNGTTTEGTHAGNGDITLTW